MSAQESIQSNARLTSSQQTMVERWEEHLRDEFELRNLQNHGNDGIGVNAGDGSRLSARRAQEARLCGVAGYPLAPRVLLYKTSVLIVTDRRHPSNRRTSV